MMIQLLFGLIFLEMGLIIMFIFKTPFRELAIIAIDGVKRGRGPTVVKTVAVTIFIVMIASVYNALAIQRRWIDDGDVTPTDQILFSTRLLQASLMGSSLFLALMVDKLHHYIRELQIRRKTMEAVKDQKEAAEYRNLVAADEIKCLEKDIIASREKIKQLELRFEEKTKEVGTAQASVLALKKQSEGFLLEYDRLHEENENLRTQLQSLDRKTSRSNSKKVS